MISAPEKIAVACPQCAKMLQVPASAAGKKGRCPGCGHVFMLAAPAAGNGPESLPDLDPLSSDPLGDVQVSNHTLAALPPEAFAPPSQPVTQPDYAPRVSRPNPNSFAAIWDHVCSTGMIPALGLMGLAVAWFLAALSTNRLSLGSLLLFAIGLWRFLRSL